MMSEEELSPPWEVAECDQHVAQAGKCLKLLAADYADRRKSDALERVPEVISVVDNIDHLYEHVPRMVLAASLTVAIARLAADDE